jgi:hypothetical protein
MFKGRGPRMDAWFYLLLSLMLVVLAAVPMLVSSYLADRRRVAARAQARRRTESTALVR